ncbi:MAG: hypothetical protein ACI4XR_00550 [Bacilli bacterium]
MSNYILKINKSNKIIKNLNQENYYEFNPKNNGNLKSFIIFDIDALNKIFMKKYLTNYKKLIMFISTLNDESSASDFMICLDEITKLKDTLNYKYKKYLKKEIYEKFLDDLIKYDKYIQNKIIAMEYNNEKMKR